MLKDKLMRFAPRLVCFVGLVGYRQGFDPKAVLGPQPELWGKSHLFIVPSTSPRNAHYRPETVEWFVRLRNYSESIASS